MKQSILKSKGFMLGLSLGVATMTINVDADTALSAPANANVSVNVSVKQPVQVINWVKGSDSDIISEGIGRSGGRGMTMARMAAVMDAQRNLLGIIKGVQIDSETLMEDLIISNDTVRREINGMLRGSQIIEEYELDEDEYYVRMRVPLYGSTDSLASIIMPELVKNTTRVEFPKVTDTELSEEEIQEIIDASYTGVIINASGLGMNPTFSPVIYDTEGRAIYGIQNLNYDAIISEGMVGYSDDVEVAAAGGRAGSNPLIIDAVGVRGGRNSTNSVNAIISVRDADTILIANEGSGILNKCAVVFVK